jgi:hypothetical protein
MPTRQTVTEQWLPLEMNPIYEVSDMGHIRSRAMRGGHLRNISGWKHKHGYTAVAIRVDGEKKKFLLHRLIAITFYGPSPLGVRHLNGDASDSRLVNLRFGTQSENCVDTVRHGMNRHAAQTHCKRGHEFTEENTRMKVTKVGMSRECRQCMRDYRRDWMRAKRAKAVSA